MEVFDNITLKQIIDFILGCIAVISVVIEFSHKIPINPWSFLFKKIGNSFNRDINIKLNELEKQQKINNKSIKELELVMENKFKEKQRNDDEKEAKRLRAHIISFADSCRTGQLHTQASFQNIFRDYSDYVSYCEENDIPNHFIDSEYTYINEIYQKCLKENNFL